ARLEKFEALAAKGDLGKEQVEEGRKLLGRMPKLKALRELRKEYQKLADGDLSVADFARARRAVLATMRIDPKLARNYADKILEAVNIVEEEYVKEVSPGKLVGGGIRGLYARLDEKLPEDLADRLEGVEKLSRAELGVLLRDVRVKLGQREDLDKHKDIDITLHRMLAPL